MDFESFMKDIRKGVGNVKKSYTELLPTMLERRATRDSKKKKKKLYEKLIDTSARKDMGNMAGVDSVMAQELYNKKRKEKKKKYSYLK